MDNTYVKISLDAIHQNIDGVAAKTGVPVMAIVKADAYGHGAVEVARQLQDKVAFFGVSSMLEARELRHAGLNKPILILGQTPVEAFPKAVAKDIRPTIFSYEDACALSAEAVKQGKTASFHFAVDTGMSRIGFQPTEESADICAEICRLPGLFAEGIFSHFATADSSDLTRAKAQAKRFDDFCEMLRVRGIEIPLKHLDNSAGLMNFSDNYSLVRSGIITYGLYPSDEMDKSALHLTPALEWHSRVTHVKWLPAGREISYGGTFVTEKDTRVATVAVGYADGYRRSLSGRFYVLIRGKRAPILGRVCMDQLMVDVTDIPEIAVEDDVVLIGKSGEEEITVEELAEAAGTFHYEIICGVSRRVPRMYFLDGKCVHTVRYLLET